MKICVLASGSKGNATYIGTKTTNLLIDLGISCLNVEKKLKQIRIKPNEIDGILITHTHVDHINGLRVFIKKYNPKIYLTEIMYKELNQWININNYEFIENDMTIGNINVEVIKTSHDTEDSNGYILSNSNTSVVYITDTGYINRKFHKKLKDKTIYIIESNHDVEMLMNGKYPYVIKKRILGDKGHLSNEDCAYYLEKLIGTETKIIILSHLSEENNTEKLAYDTIKNKLDRKDLSIIIAKQNERTELIEVWLQ